MDRKSYPTPHNKAVHGDPLRSRLTATVEWE